MKYIFYLMFLLLPSSAYGQALWEYLGFTQAQVVASCKEEDQLFENINKDTGQLMLTKTSPNGISMTLYNFTGRQVSSVLYKSDLKLMREICGLTTKPDIDGLYNFFNKAYVDENGFQYLENISLNNLNFRKYKRGGKLVFLHADSNLIWIIAKYE